MAIDFKVLARKGVKPDQVIAILGKLAAAKRPATPDPWLTNARASQLEPPGDWNNWLIQTGRGWGKTRTASEWVKMQVTAGKARRIALIGPTAADVRDVMVEGVSGILATARPDFRPVYEPSKRRLTWPNGAVATTYSAEDPDQLRGPEHDCAWLDELASWKRAARVWDMFTLGFRLGTHPRAVITTTPQPVATIKRIANNPKTFITRGSTLENEANLAPAFIDTIIKTYAGTRIGRQEIDGEYLEDVEGALFRYEWISDNRSEPPRPQDLRFTIVSLDHAISATERSDFSGIAVVQTDYLGQIYVRHLERVKLDPESLVTRVLALSTEYGRAPILLEDNQGGDFIESAFTTKDRYAPILRQPAVTSKKARAFPVSLLYQQGRIHHVGIWPVTEGEMCLFTGEKDSPNEHDDDIDALVHAVNYLTKHDGTGNKVVAANTGKPLQYLEGHDNRPTEIF